MHRKVFYRQTYTAPIQCIQKWFTVTEETANIDHFPQIYTLHERGAKTLGMRQSAVSSLTGYVGTVRQSGTSSPVRHLQPPMNTVSFRHPDYAQGRDSLTSIMGSLSSARVEDPHFADCNNQLTHYQLTLMVTLSQE